MERPTNLPHILVYVSLTCVPFIAPQKQELGKRRARKQKKATSRRESPDGGVGALFQIRVVLDVEHV